MEFQFSDVIVTDGKITKRIVWSPIIAIFLYDVISSLDNCKRKLVSSTGFEGILHFPDVGQINRQFSLVNEQVDHSEHKIVIDGNRLIKFSKDNVAAAFGIPCSGSGVNADGMPSKDTINLISSEFLGFHSKEYRSVKPVRALIERIYCGVMSPRELDSKGGFCCLCDVDIVSSWAKYDWRGNPT